MLINKLKYISTLTTTLLISACTSQAEIQVLDNWPKGDHAIETAQFIQNDRFFKDADHLIIYEGQGLVIQDKAGAKLQSLEGSFASLDHRVRASGLIIATEDSNKQQIMISQLMQDTMQWSDRTYLPKADFKVEGLCLYQDTAENVYAFLVGEEGQGQQWLVANQQQPLKTALLIRQLSLPPASEYCQVDDQQAAMYINEENVGVWQYDTNPESHLDTAAVVDFVLQNPLTWMTLREEHA